MKYQIIVVGAGPAGLMAAITAARAGAEVLVVEKNSRAGLKLLATGGGRCNLTNVSLADLSLAQLYGPRGRFLLPAIKACNPAAVVEFFASRGLETVVEAEGRVFPRSGSAGDVLKVLLTEAKAAGVSFLYSLAVAEVQKLEDAWQLRATDGQVLQARVLILATGGQSYPATGSSGDAYAWLKSLGHSVVTPRAILVPILTSKSVKSLEGLSLEAVELRWPDRKAKVRVRGPVMFTAEGISGPAVLNFSRLLPPAPAWPELVLDLLPAWSVAEIESQLASWRQNEGVKLVKTLLGRLLPPRLVDLLLAELKLPELKMADLSAEHRRQLVANLKAWPLPARALGGFDKAVVTAGGLSLVEVDQRRLESKLCSGLFVAGELLDLDGPTGGYNLQLCWSSGVLAGTAAAEALLD